LHVANQKLHILRASFGIIFISISSFFKFAGFDMRVLFLKTDEVFFVEDDYQNSFTLFATQLNDVFNLNKSGNLPKRPNFRVFTWKKKVSPRRKSVTSWVAYTTYIQRRSNSQSVHLQCVLRYKKPTANTEGCKYGQGLLLKVRWHVHQRAPCWAATTP